MNKLLETREAVHENQIKLACRNGKEIMGKGESIGVIRCFLYGENNMPNEMKVIIKAMMKS